MERKREAYNVMGDEGIVIRDPFIPVSYAAATDNLLLSHDSAPITILGPFHPYRGGIAHHTTALAFALRDAGHTVRPVTFRRQYPRWRKWHRA